MFFFWPKCTQPNHIQKSQVIAIFALNTVYDWLTEDIIILLFNPMTLIQMFSEIVCYSFSADVILHLLPASILCCFFLYLWVPVYINGKAIVYLYCKMIEWMWTR